MKSLPKQINKYFYVPWETFPEGVEIFKKYIEARNIKKFVRGYPSKQKTCTRYKNIFGAYKYLPLCFEDHSFWFENHSREPLCVLQPYMNIEKVKQIIDTYYEFRLACLKYDINFSVIHIGGYTCGWHHSETVLLELSPKYVGYSHNLTSKNSFSVNTPFNWHIYQIADN